MDTTINRKRMKRLLIGLILLIPLIANCSCQEKYDALPYDEEEARLRTHNAKDTALIIYKNWEKRDSMSYLRFKNTRHIDLYQIDTIPCWITKFQHTRILSSVPIGEIPLYIPQSIGNMSKLEVLTFHNAPIDYIPISIWRLSNLKTLALMGNGGVIIPKDIKKLKKLEELLLDNFLNVSNEIFELKNLKVLWLMNCNISVLPPSIKNLKQLEWLDLGNNPLDRVPEEFFELTNLRKFYYDEDRIDEDLRKRIDEFVLNNELRFRKIELEKMKKAALE